jgi:hypothetical protein
MSNTATTVKSRCATVKVRNPNLEKKCRKRPAALFAAGSRVKGLLYGCVVTPR